MADPIYRFAHLSDPHLSSLDRIKTWDLASKRVLGYINWRRHRKREHRREVLTALVEDLHRMAPEHTVVTGDLTNLGLPSECEEAAAWLQTLGAPQNVTVVPGNHDTYVPARWTSTVGLWSAYLSDDPTLAIGPETVFPTLRVRGEVAFIGVSTAVPSSAFLAIGTIGPQQMARLREILTTTREQGLYRVVLIHHPPLAETVKARKGLTDGHSLRGLLAETGAELVLHGHAHFVAGGSLPGPKHPVRVVGVPSASAANPSDQRRAQYNLYTLGHQDGHWQLTVEVRGFFAAEHGFRELRREVLE